MFTLSGTMRLICGIYDLYIFGNVNEIDLTSHFMVDIFHLMTVASRFLSVVAKISSLS